MRLPRGYTPWGARSFGNGFLSYPIRSLWRLPLATCTASLTPYIVVGMCDDGVRTPATFCVRPLTMSPTEPDDALLPCEVTAPDVERAAAIVVAQYMCKALSREADGDNGTRRNGPHGPQPLSIQLAGAMPMKRFVDCMPEATRDAIFLSGYDVPTWVARATLVELVYLLADGTVSTVPPPASIHGSGLPHESPTPHYGALLFVRVKGDPRRLLLEFGAAGGGGPAGTECRHADGEQEARDAAVDHAATSVRDELGADQVDENAAATFLNESQVEALLDALQQVVRHKTASNGYRYCLLSDAYNATARRVTQEPTRVPLLADASKPLTFAAFEQVLFHHPLANNRFWHQHNRFVAVRESGEASAPRFQNPQPRTIVATEDTNYGGWGSLSNIPTREDVYEILRYVPINWGNFGNLSIPSTVKKKHIRISSTLQWFRRQPYYFEIRNMNGTTEIRRSITLHPEAHHLTIEEAQEQLQYKIATGEANSLLPVGADGHPLESAMPTSAKLVHKFLYRVCPAYFVPLSLVMQRYTKKNLTEAHLLSIAKSKPNEFEIAYSKYSDIPLVRKRAGADSNRWRHEFQKDLDRHPEDVRGIMMLFNRMCSSWDRPEYIFVRLGKAERMAIGGFDCMVQILKRHPNLFRVGRHFVCRVDASDATLQLEDEPSPDDITSRTFLREENPYLSPLDVALVFHYVAPADEACTASFFVERSSPVMRVALPPRIITILQQFPNLFACKETSPGVYSIRKLTQRVASKTSTAFSTATPVASGTGAEEEDATWELEAEMAADEQLSRGELVAAVMALIPDSGVECSQLLLWASMSVQQAANHYYGGLVKMVEQEAKHFKVVDNHHTKMVHPRGGA